MSCWPCPAKLNLFLYITGQRPDGYHNLQTLFQLIDFCDTLTIKLNKNYIQIISDLPNVDEHKNLIYIAATHLQHYTKSSFGATLTLTKRIPMGGGLGGASSNAATTLLALNYLWGCQLSEKELLHIGQQIGADVPVFIAGYSAFAEGIGERLTPVTLPEKWYLIVKPDVHIATVDIFSASDLTRNTPKRSLTELLHTTYRNDCEQTVRKKYDNIESLINWLLQYAPTRLTGTGACVFAEFDTQIEAEHVFAKLPFNYHAVVAKGLNRSPLREKLEQLR